MTPAMAEAWSADSITTNAVVPGFLRTELTGPVFDKAALAQKHADNICMDRNDEPSDPDGSLMLFSSDASSYMTGQTLFVDGGCTAE